MRQTLLAVLTLLALPGEAFAGPQSLNPAATEAFLSRMDALRQGGPVIAAACCKVCHKGQACGDSCISRDKSCHKGAGCACNG